MVKRKDGLCSCKICANRRKDGKLFLPENELEEYENSLRIKTNSVKAFYEALKNNRLRSYNNSSVDQLRGHWDNSDGIDYYPPKENYSEPYFNGMIADELENSQE